MVHRSQRNIHGDWEVRVLDSNIIVSRVFGAWNVEAAVAFSSEFKNIASGFGGEAWACILCVVNAQLIIPDGIPVLKEVERWSLNHGRRCLINLGSNHMQRSQFNEISGSGPELAVGSYYCKTLSEALPLLAQNGFDTSFDVTEVEQWLMETKGECG